MQGFTLPAGKVDLNLSSHADPVTGYVAMSRFNKADDVLIIQVHMVERCSSVSRTVVCSLCAGLAWYWQYFELQ